MNFAAPWKTIQPWKSKRENIYFFTIDAGSGNDKLNGYYQPF